MEPIIACLLQYGRGYADAQCHYYDIDHEVFCLAIHKSRFLARLCEDETEV